MRLHCDDFNFAWLMSWELGHFPLIYKQTHLHYGRVVLCSFICGYLSFIFINMFELSIYY